MERKTKTMRQNMNVSKLAPKMERYWDANELAFAELNKIASMRPKKRKTKMNIDDTPPKDKLIGALHTPIKSKRIAKLSKSIDKLEKKYNINWVFKKLGTHFINIREFPQSIAFLNGNMSDRRYKISYYKSTGDGTGDGTGDKLIVEHIRTIVAMRDKIIDLITTHFKNSNSDIVMFYNFIWNEHEIYKIHPEITSISENVETKGGSSSYSGKNNTKPTKTSISSTTQHGFSDRRLIDNTTHQTVTIISKTSGGINQGKAHMSYYDPNGKDYNPTVKLLVGGLHNYLNNVVNSPIVYNSRDVSKNALQDILYNVDNVQICFMACVMFAYQYIKMKEVWGKTDTWIKYLSYYITVKFDSRIKQSHKKAHFASKKPLAVIRLPRTRNQVENLLNTQSMTTTDMKKIMSFIDNFSAGFAEYVKELKRKDKSINKNNSNSKSKNKPRKKRTIVKARRFRVA